MTYGISQSLFCALIYALSLNPKLELLTLEYGVILDHYVERYGIEDYETSVKAIERITQFTTCEFVTHAFIVKYQDEMMKQMLAWSKHPHWGG